MSDHGLFAMRSGGELDELYNATSPCPGRPGWRRDGAGREWFSAAWIGTRSALDDKLMLPGGEREE